MSMVEPLAIFWDHGEGGNVEHLAEHGVTPDEAEQVIENTSMIVSGATRRLSTGSCVASLQEAGSFWSSLNIG